MAGIFLVMSLFWAVRYNGFWGLVKHIFGVKMETSKWVYPLFLLLFLFIGVMELVSIVFARPVALAMRLYGNIFAGETILDMTFHMKSCSGRFCFRLWFIFTKHLCAWCRRLYLRCWSWRLSARCAPTRKDQAIEFFEFPPASDAGATTKTKRKKKYMMLAETDRQCSYRSGLRRRVHRHRHRHRWRLIAMSRNPGMFGKILDVHVRRHGA